MFACFFLFPCFLEDILFARLAVRPCPARGPFCEEQEVSHTTFCVRIASLAASKGCGNGGASLSFYVCSRLNNLDNSHPLILATHMPKYMPWGCMACKSLALLQKKEALSETFMAYGPRLSWYKNLTLCHTN